MKQRYYDISRIRNTDANFYILMGEKSNGKSYQAKVELQLKHYLQTGKRFILLRRGVNEMTSTWVDSYFNDIDVSNLTDGKYTHIDLRANKLYFAKFDDNYKLKRGEQVGYAFSLYNEQKYASGSFLDVDTIVYEEFISRSTYLPNEPSKLMTLYSTVDRKRGITKLWLIGNTITRVNPYLKEWDLYPVIRDMKQGDIRTLKCKTENGFVTIAIEHCENSGGRAMTIGNASKMIDAGEWLSDPQPKLEKPLREYKQLLKIQFIYKSFKFNALYLCDNVSRETLWYIYPMTKRPKKKLLTFSDEVKQSRYTFRSIYNVFGISNRIKEILYNFGESNIFFSDDLTGTEFKQTIDFILRR